MNSFRLFLTCVLVLQNVLLSEERDFKQTYKAQFKRFDSIVRNVHKRVMVYIEKNSNVSIFEISEMWEDWLKNPTPSQFFEILRMTMWLMIGQLVSLIRKSSDFVGDYLTPRAKEIFHERVEPYVYFNPYDHVGRDSVAQYIQKSLIFTFGLLAFPFAISFFGWINSFLFVLLMLVVHQYGGILAVYKFSLLILSLFIVGIETAIHYPIMALCFFGFLFYIGRSDDISVLQKELNYFRREIRTLSERIDRLKK